MKKELKKLIRDARKRGWEIDLTGNGHYKWVLPGRGVFFTASTPSDRRALLNIQSNIRRYER